MAISKNFAFGSDSGSKSSKQATAEAFHVRPLRSPIVSDHLARQSRQDVYPIGPFPAHVRYQLIHISLM